jgi:hypothetical protein
MYYKINIIAVTFTMNTLKQVKEKRRSELKVLPIYKEGKKVIDNSQDDIEIYDTELLDKIMLKNQEKRESDFTNTTLSKTEFINFESLRTNNIYRNNYNWEGNHENIKYIGGEYPRRKSLSVNKKLNCFRAQN